MPWCDQFSKLCSEALDRPLTSHENVGLRFHLISCENCRNLNVNFVFIRNMLKNYDDNMINDETIVLTEKAAHRIHQTLMKAFHESNF